MGKWVGAGDALLRQGVLTSRLALGGGPASEIGVSRKPSRRVAGGERIALFGTVQQVLAARTSAADYRVQKPCWRLLARLHVVKERGSVAWPAVFCGVE